MTRSELLPEIFYDESLESSELELFQNKYLRAILKYQDFHLKALSIEACEKMNPKYKELNERKRLSFLSKMIQNDQAFRNQLVGLIIGFLEEEQFNWYLENKSTCNKRILQMAHKRIVG